MNTSYPVSASWFAVQCRYRHEQKIVGELKAKGMESYLPTLREVHTWQDRKKTMDVPAFGGYLFTRFEPTLHNRVRVLETTGVVKILGYQGKPEPVSEREIASLRQALESGAPATHHPYMAVGTHLRIRRGPLAGLEGCVVRIANGFKLVVNVPSVCQAIAVEVSQEDVDLIKIPSEFSGSSLMYAQASA